METRPKTKDELKAEFKKIKKQEKLNLDHEVEGSIGKERSENLSDSLEQLEAGIKELILRAEEKEKGSGEKIEKLFNEVSGNIFSHGYKGTQNARPEQLIKALEELRDKTNFA